MNVNLNYTAPDVETLCAAIQSLRALGIAPSVSTTTPAHRPPASVGKQGEEPNVEAYQQGRINAGHPPKGFRVWKSEKARGITSREQAAIERMSVPGWEGASDPQGESVSVADTMSDDSEPLPDGFQVF